MVEMCMCQQNTYRLQSLFPDEAFQLVAFCISVETRIDDYAFSGPVPCYAAAFVQVIEIEIFYL